MFSLLFNWYNHILYSMFFYVLILRQAVVRPIGGHAVSLKWSMHGIYNIKPHEVWFTASDLGWVVGHSYICYAPLLNCNTTIIYEVGIPCDMGFLHMIEYNIERNVYWYVIKLRSGTVLTFALCCM